MIFMYLWFFGLVLFGLIVLEGFHSFKWFQVQMLQLAMIKSITISLSAQFPELRPSPILPRVLVSFCRAH